jgi:Bacterial membrane protein YfhO
VGILTDSDGGSDQGPERATPRLIASGGSVPWWVDLLGVAWLLAAAVAVMLPSLLRGTSLGPYSLLIHDGLLQQHRGGGRDAFAADQITQMIPWSSLAWTQVHQGLLPLWNPYNVLGTPLAFNWQSATFSLPSLLGYLAPARMAYTIQVLVTMAIGGTGVYVLGRVQRLNVLACVFGATVFELSGSFIGWLGWPVSSVLSWAGWLFAATVLIFRGGHRVRSVALFSLALAFAVYAGEPDTLILLASFLGVFVTVLFVMRALSSRGWPEQVRHLGDVAVATVAGLFLAAPLLLPGGQLLVLSSRDVGGRAFSGQQALSLPRLVTIVLPGLDGQPLAWHRSYIGVVAVGLALVGLICRRRRPEVVAAGAVAVIAGIVCFTPAVDSLLYDIPGLGAVRWARSVSFLELGIAVLAGVGLDVLIRSFDKRAVLRLAAAVFSVAAVTALLIWVTHPRGDAIRHQNLLWAGGGALLGLILIGALEVMRRRRAGSDISDPAAGGRRGLLRTAGLWAALLLFAFQTAFLLTMGGSQWPSTERPFHGTRAERQLKRVVGSSLVAFGAPACQAPPTLGIPANANIAYGVHELAVYDPMLPLRYYQAWAASTGRKAGYPATSRYCPGVTTATMARSYGVSFVLEFHGAHGPTGGVFVTKVGDEDLYRIPGAGQATLVAAPTSGRLPSDEAPGSPVAVTFPDPASWKVVVDPSVPSVLQLHLTDVPGWHASIDGHPLPLARFSGVMLQALVPAGHHVIVLHYWPTAFTAGIVLAVISAAGLIVAAVIAVNRRRALRNRSEQQSASVSI